MENLCKIAAMLQLIESIRNSNVIVLTSAMWPIEYHSETFCFFISISVNSDLGAHKYSSINTSYHNYSAVAFIYYISR